MTIRRAVYAGSFDPIHYGHINIASRGARLFDELIVAVYDRPAKTLLFNFEERAALVRRAFEHVPNITVTGFSGLAVDFCRSVDAKIMVRGLRVFSDFEFEFRMALANRRLDPTIEVVELITDERNTFLSSTTVREIAQLGGDVSSMVPPFVAEALRAKYLTPTDSHTVPSSLGRD